jgi:hypothetical protein
MRLGLRQTATVDAFVKDKGGIGRVSIAFNVFFGNNSGDKRRRKVAWGTYKRN